MTTMESENWIVCVEQSQVTMVDLKNGGQVTRRNISAEAAVMNPSASIIALRSGTTVQIFNLEAKQKLKAYSMPENIVYWKWADASTLAMVTGSAVYHWALAGAADPVKVFDRHSTLGANTQIINYQYSPDQKWCLLGGISAGAQGNVNGNMQLYSIEKKVSQPLQGHAGAFAKIKIIGREDPAQVLVFHEKKADNPADHPKLFVMEVGRDPSKGAGFRLPPTQIPVPAEAAADFPVSLVVSKKDDVAYLVTKMGYMYMFDVHSGKTMHRAKATQDTIFCTTYQESTGSILGITVRKGQVFRISINGQALVPYIVTTLRYNELAIKVAGRLNLPGAES
jgi:clathrin heavy chain